MFIRYKQVNVVYVDRNDGFNLNSTLTLKILKLNKWSFISGIILLTFHSTTNNFNIKEFFYFHNFAANMQVLFMMITIILNTRLSFLTSQITSKRIAKIRLIITLMLIIGLIFFTIMTVLSISAFKNDFYSSARLFWKHSDGGYVYHVIASITQWILFFLSTSFFGTFYHEFKRIRIMKLVLLNNI